jgi:hypothetical protein
MTEPRLLAVLHDGLPMEEREERLTTMADTSSSRRRSFVTSDRFLLTLAAALMTLGVAAIIIGWLGASDSILIEEQVPYLISGGQLGGALAVIGGQCLFAHWLTVSIREARAHNAARRAEHEQLIQQVATLTAALLERDQSANGTAPERPRERPLRRAPRSS